MVAHRVQNEQQLKQKGYLATLTAKKRAYQDYCAAAVLIAANMLDKPFLRVAER